MFGLSYDLYMICKLYDFAQSHEPSINIQYNTILQYTSSHIGGHVFVPLIISVSPLSNI